MNADDASAHTPPQHLEAETQRIGLSFARDAGGRSPELFASGSLRGRLIARALHDEGLRTRLFRFVDVLPQLESPEAIAEHFHAYLGGQELGGAWGRAWALGAMPATAFAVRRSVRQLARLFLAEETPHQLARVLESLAWLPARVSLDAVGEAVLGEAEADAYRDRVLHLIQTLAEAPRADSPDVSVKLSALTPRFDPIDPEGTAARVWKRLTPIAEAASHHAVALTVDMEQNEFRPLILSLFLDLAYAWPEPAFRVGIALQAYLKDAEHDLDRLIDAAIARPLAVRLVKGAYWDSEQAWAARRDWPIPVHLDKAATDLQFESMTRRLLASTDTIYPMIASHNPRSQAHALAVARSFGVADHAWEAQMLYGMAEPLRDALIAAGVPLRIYLPTGDLVSGIAYLIRRLLENTAGSSILRQAYGEGVPLATLLAPPQVAAPPALPALPFALPFAHAPLADFSQATRRDALAWTLIEVRDELGRDYPLAGGGDWLTSRNPAKPAEVIGRVQTASPEQVDASVAAARAAFPAWRDTPVGERAACLRSAAHHIDCERNRFAAWEILEAGKNWREADADVAEAVDMLRYYAAQMEALDGWRDNLPAGGPDAVIAGELNQSRYEAVGPAAIIAPWNFPLAILAGMSAAALAAGCPVLLKPASLTPVIAWHYRRILLEAGIPAAVVQWLPGAGGQVGQRLVSHPEVAAVAFTGSREVGLTILERAHARGPGQRLVKRVICEMGGKNAIIVDEDADLDEAVGEIIASAFGYQGQKCSAASRIIAVGPIHDRLLARLTAALDTWEIGPPENPRYALGPLIDGAALEKALAYLEIGAREGRLAYAGRAPVVDNGHYFAPVIFTDIRPHHRLAREEIFAPILAILQAPDFTQAQALARDSDYALTGGVFSRHPEHLQQARASYRVGNLYLNRRITGARVGVQPFGGTALSGSGIPAGGPDTLKQFLWTRTVSENTLRHGFAA